MTAHNAAIDPMALELTRDINEALKKQEQLNSQYENEDLAQVKIRVLRGHRNQVRTCQFCYNDQKVFSASYDKTCKLWDFDSGTELQTYADGHDKYITQAKLDSINNRFVSAGWDKRLIMWDVVSGNVMWQSDHAGIVTGCDLSTDGKLVVSASDLDNFIRIWDAQNGALIREIKGHHSSTITSLQFSPCESDRLVSTSMDGTTKVYDLRTGETTITLGGHINVISHASFSQDERWLATVSWDKCVKVWDVSTGHYRSDGSIKFDRDHEGSVSSCRWSVDGEYLVTGSYDQSVCVWDIENKAQKLKLLAHDGWVLDVDISRDKKWLLTASQDRTLRVWDIENSDNMPMLLDQKKTIGMKVTTCPECGKPFSVGKSEPGDQATICVFCRLAKRVFSIDINLDLFQAEEKTSDTEKENEEEEKVTE